MPFKKWKTGQIFVAFPDSELKKRYKKKDIKKDEKDFKTTYLTEQECSPTVFNPDPDIEITMHH